MKLFHNSLKTSLIMVASAILLLVPHGSSVFAASTQQQLEVATNYWMTGLASLPAVQHVVSYDVYQGYALVNWTSAGGNAGGQLVLLANGTGYSIIFGSGGMLQSADIAPYGVPPSAAAYLLNPANFVNAVADAPAPTPVPSANILPRPSLTVVRKTIYECLMNEVDTLMPGDYDFLGTQVPAGQELIETILPKNPRTCGNARRRRN